MHDEARRILGRARTDLEFRRAGELLRDLPAHLREVQAACAGAPQPPVSGRYFRHTEAIEWSA